MAAQNTPYIDRSGLSVASAFGNKIQQEFMDQLITDVIKLRNTVDSMSILLNELVAAYNNHNHQADGGQAGAHRTTKPSTGTVVSTLSGAVTDALVGSVGTPVEVAVQPSTEA